MNCLIYLVLFNVLLMNFKKTSLMMVTKTPIFRLIYRRLYLKNGGKRLELLVFNTFPKS